MKSRFHLSVTRTTLTMCGKCLVCLESLYHLYAIHQFDSALFYFCHLLALVSHFNIVNDLSVAAHWKVTFSVHKFFGWTSIKRVPWHFRLTGILNWSSVLLDLQWMPLILCWISQIGRNVQTWFQSDFWKREMWRAQNLIRIQGGGVVESVTT